MLQIGTPSLVKKMLVNVQKIKVILGTDILPLVDILNHRYSTRALQEWWSLLVKNSHNSISDHVTSATNKLDFMSVRKDVVCCWPQKGGSKLSRSYEIKMVNEIFSMMTNHFNDDKPMKKLVLKIKWPIIEKKITLVMRLAGLSCRVIIYVMVDEKGGSGRKGLLNVFTHK